MKGVTSQEIAEALKLLDALYEQSHSVATWLTGNTTQQESYEVVKRQLEEENTGLCVLRVNLTYRTGHVLAPID